MVYKDAVQTFRSNSKFVNLVQPRYDKTYSAMGAKEGEAIRLMTPAEFTVREGNNLQVQDVEEKNVTLTRSVLRGVDFKFSSAEMTQDVEAFNKTKVEPAMAALAAKIDAYCMNQAYKEVHQAVTLPVTSLDRLDALRAGVQLDNGLAPENDRCLILNPQGMMDMVDSSSGLFNNSTSISQQYDDGIIKVPAMGFNFARSTNVPVHTTGTFTAGSTPLTNGAGTEGASTIVTNGWANSTLVLTAGDIITFDGVNQVNALTKTTTGNLKQFVVTAAGTSNGSGELTISIEPALISTGQYQNIDALPANDVAVNPLGTEATAYPQNMAFNKGFGALGFIDLESPSGATIIRRANDGISMRMWIDRDINTNSEIFRFDVLFGYKTIVPRWASRIYGV
jgi:hypothetical protein